LTIDRKQRVAINGKSLQWSGVLSGVPLLQLIVFIIYVNDIDLGFNGRILKSADE